MNTYNTYFNNINNKIKTCQEEIDDLRKRQHSSFLKYLKWFLMKQIKLYDNETIDFCMEKWLDIINKYGKMIKDTNLELGDLYEEKDELWENLEETQ